MTVDSERLNMSKSNVQFWFDPICPWAFMTSRWLLEVEKIRDISITWNLFSLAHLNKDKDLAPEYKARLIRSWQATRVIAAAQEKNGKEITLPLYTAISSRIHLKKMDVGQELFTQALKEVGADENLASAESDSKFDNAIIASHEAGIALVGSDVGTPIIAVEGTAFFGPVISPAPRGEEAGKLWDGVLLAASYPGFFEIKRSRTVGPIFE